ncbi:MAG: thermonuclease family protein [Candidatus Sungbacteria bacterium]|nr:thermonuclease family protein [Candidatus Sungbacteria bacterium]
MKKALSGFFILLFLAALTGALYYFGIKPETAETPKQNRERFTNETFRVIKVIDGDTIIINDGGKNMRVRLIGVRAPEKPGGRLAPQCFGEEASRYLQRKIEGKNIRLQKDRIGDKEDQYKRLLRYVWLDEELINAALIRDGYAYAYRKFRFEKKPEFRALEKEAKIAKKGLWNSKRCPQQQKQKTGAILMAPYFIYSPG